VLMLVTPPIWIDAFTVTLCAALILLSIVVLTGYTGQLSLAQFALAGFGAWVAGRLIATQGVPFWLGLLIGLAGVYWPAFVLDSLSFLASFVLILGLPAAAGAIDHAPADGAGTATSTQLGLGASLRIGISRVAHSGHLLTRPA